MAKPYVAANRGVARADATRLLSSNDRRLSEQSRRVEDPMEVKDKIAKVLAHTLYRLTTVYEENIPICLKQKFRSRFG